MPESAVVKVKFELRTAEYVGEEISPVGLSDSSDDAWNKSTVDELNMLGLGVVKLDSALELSLVELEPTVEEFSSSELCLVELEPSVEEPNALELAWLNWNQLLRSLILQNCAWLN